MFLPIFKVFSNLKTWGAHLAISTKDRFLPQGGVTHTCRQGSLRVAAPSPTKENHKNSLKYFSVFCLNCKIRHASTNWKELIRKSLCLPIFRNITEIAKKLRVYLGDPVTKLQTFVWIFNHVLRVTTWSLFNLRAPNLVKQPISTRPFIWWQFWTAFYSLSCLIPAAGNLTRDCLVFFKEQKGFEFWVLRFRVLGAPFSSLGCSVFEIWVLRFRDLSASYLGLRFRVLRFRNYQ